MTCMRARTSLNFGLLGSLAAELAALERLKNPHRLIMRKQCIHFFWAVLDLILSYLQVMITYIGAWMGLRFV